MKATGAARGAKDLPQGFAERTFASSDRRGVGRACCGNCTGTGGAQDSTETFSTRHASGQFEHVCVEKCPLTTRHTANRSGDSCEGSQRLSFVGSAPWRPKRGKLNHGNEPRSPTRRCSEQIRVERRHGMTSSTRPGGEERPPWTIAGNRAEQSPDERRSVQTFEAEAPVAKCSRRRTRACPTAGDEVSMFNQEGHEGGRQR